MAVSPNVNNYYLGKGNVYVSETATEPGTGDWRHVGNVPEFEFTPEIENLEHFSSMEGVRTKDRTIVLEKSGQLRMVLEEFTPENLAVALLGTQEDNSDGDAVIEIFAENSKRLAVKFVGSNDVGPRYEAFFPGVDFIPSAAIGLINEEWGNMELTGDVVTVGGSFGTITRKAGEGFSDDASEPSE